MAESILFTFDCVNDSVRTLVNIYTCCGDNRGTLSLVLNLKFLVKPAIKSRLPGKCDAVLSGVHKGHIIGGIRFT